MQAYGKALAAIYSRIWSGFAKSFAPHVFEKAGGAPERSLLDLFCGTGRLCDYFLERGWEALGLDASPGMLAQAALENRRWIEKGLFSTVEADASKFTLDRRFGFVTALFDAINHLPDEEALAGCFAGAHAALLPGGSFLFDVNTRRGLASWSVLDIQDEDDLYLVKRGLYVEEEDRAWLKIIGFHDRGGGNYERFDEVVWNRAWPVARLVALLGRAGFEAVETLQPRPGLPAAFDPELEDRVFVMARRPRGS